MIITIKKTKLNVHLRFSLLILILLTIVGAARGATFTVTNTNDSGSGSLRQAILDSNVNGGADDIAFNISGSSVQSIRPATALPNLVGPVTVDGYTQPGASPNTLAIGNNAVLRIELDGSLAGGGSRGLRLAGTGVIVRGLIINRFDSAGIETLEGSGGHIIAGNFIGTDANGALDFGNGNIGVFLFRSANVRIGGTAPADRNLISGNNNQGIGSQQGDGNHLIQGNYIGTNAAGTAAVGNNTGIGIDTNNVIVGGTTAGAGNVISGNNARGLDISNSSGSNRTIQGNLIGTNAAGSAPVANGESGIAASGFSLIIGGAGAGNVVSGNVGFGNELFDAQGALVQGNLVGTAADSATALGNSLSGIQLGFNNGGFFFGGPTLVGGTTAGAANTIAFNGGSGISAVCCEGRPHTFSRNSIFSNGGLGIEFGPGGVNTNDPMDTDGGTNNGQNYPVLSTVSSYSGNTTIRGILNSVSSTNFTLEFFSNSQCDASNHGEGKAFIGSASVSTDTNGDAQFNVTFPVSLTGGFVTSTATRLNSSGNPTDTSEFSACAQLITPTAAAVRLGGRVFAENGGRGIGKVSVTLTGFDGQTRTTLTNPFGYYRFDEIPSGQTYLISISSKRYVFSNSVQVINATEDLTEVNFWALQPNDKQ